MGHAVLKHPKFPIQGEGSSTWPRYRPQDPRALITHPRGHNLEQRHQDSMPFRPRPAVLTSAGVLLAWGSKVRRFQETALWE